MASLEGQLLVATSDLTDPNFFRTVVLVVRHSDEGALGLVLNRRSQTTIQEAWKQIRDTACKREDRLDVGGPCQGPLTSLFMATESKDAASNLLSGGDEVAKGIFFSGDSEVIERLVDDDDAQVRFFVGYSGWGAGQLEAEMAQGAWRVAPVQPEHVIPFRPDLWEDVTRWLHGQWLNSALGIRDVPDDASMN